MRHVIFICLFVICTGLFFLESAYAAQKKKKPACKPPKAGVVVVNFSGEDLFLFVNNRLVGKAPIGQQKLFKKVLPVGEAMVDLRTGSAATSQVRQQSIIKTVNEGKKTCSKITALLVKGPIFGENASAQAA